MAHFCHPVSTIPASSAEVHSSSSHICSFQTVPDGEWGLSLPSKAALEHEHAHPWDQLSSVPESLRTPVQICHVAAGSAITSELCILEASNSSGEWKVVLPRKPDVEYEIADRADHLFILRRDPDRPNSELLVAPVSDPTKTTVSSQLACSD